MRFEPLQLFSEQDRPKQSVDLAAPRQERRERTRSPVRWPILLFKDTSAGTAETVTENLNCSGFFCFSELPVATGDVLSCVLRIPTCDTRPDASTLTLLCRVRVLRVERAFLHAPVGIACRIEDYRCVSGGLDF